MMTTMEKSIIPLKTIHEIKANSFIFEQKNSIPPEACAEIIRRFEASSEDQYQGRVGQTANLQSEIKKTTDIAVSGKEHWKDVDNGFHYSLGKAMMEFRETFPYFKGPFKDIGYNIQRYQPGEYYHWHIDGGSHDFSQRQLVALWYLNDVPSPGGETQFLYQDVSITPEAGKLVLFPPFWTHEHRAAVIQEGIKYIATTWIVFA
jgi:Rps23 Pro-64 3,4-dihydroxylase Tpa1-like proline 4-hydroxylase